MRYSLINGFRRYLTALLQVSVVSLNLLHLFLSIAAFYRGDELFTLMDRRDPVGIVALGMLFLASLSPLVSSLLFVRLSKIRLSSGWRHVIALVVTVYYVISTISLFYRSATGIAFDFSVLRYHFTDAIRTLLILGRQYIPDLTLGLSLVVLYYCGLVSLYRGLTRHKAREAYTATFVSRGILFGCLCFLLISHALADNGTSNLVFEFSGRPSKAKELYLKHFEDSVKHNKKQQFLARDINLKLIPNLFVVQLESLNARLVNPYFTPRLLQVARAHGVHFPQIQSTSVFTVLAMESILCAVLPAATETLASSRRLSEGLVCLPKIMKQLGFRTLFFQVFPDLQFNNVGEFLRSIGFDEVHSSRIMKSADDPLLAWGYREDIFYRRVFEYLKRFDGERIFVYMVVGSANHYPFYDREREKAFHEFSARLPFANPKNSKERIANTTYLQDHFFGQMYEESFSKTYGLNSHMIVFGDHSWPIEIHKGNNHNITGAFQENFVTSMTFLPAKSQEQKNRYLIGKEVTTLYSHIDLFPTILDLYGVSTNHRYGESLLGEFSGTRKGRARKKCIVSVQPYSGGLLALIDYPKKHIFDLKRGRVASYDLQGDADERAPREDVIDKEHLDLINTCLVRLREGQ